MNNITVKMDDMGKEVTISKECSISKKPFSITVSTEDYIRFQAGREHVQNIFPKMSADKREFLISGITPAEWEEFVCSPE